MTHTVYDSPDNAKPSLSIDLTTDYVWFFEHDHYGEVAGCARVCRSELRAIYKAIGDYLADAFDEGV